MGLTIHYRLQAPQANAAEIRQLIESLRTKALRLPFQRVGEVIDYQAGQTNLDALADPDRWMLQSVRTTVEHGDHYLRVSAERTIAFSILPGEGCEPADIGLALFPATVEVRDRDGIRSIPTGLTGWSWSSFCKTQFASNPAHGGAEHFLKCHLAVIGMLDQANALDLVQSVHDESDYWQKRDFRALAGAVGAADYMQAGWTDRLKHAFGASVLAEIMRLPNCEHLQALEHPAAKQRTSGHL